MITKKKAISLSIPIRVYEMLEELTKMTFSTKTKIIVDGIRKEYQMYKQMDIDIKGDKDVN